MPKPDGDRDQEMAELLREVRALRASIERLQPGPRHELPPEYAVAVRIRPELPPDYAVAVRPQLPPDYAVAVRIQLPQEVVINPAVLEQRDADE